MGSDGFVVDPPSLVIRRASASEEKAMGGLS